jgi:hypothetical protein
MFCHSGGRVVARYASGIQVNRQPVPITGKRGSVNNMMVPAILHASDAA